jgi:hypothetical protein
MKIARSRPAVRRALLAALLSGAASPLAAQTTKMPSTLAFGSGYLDVPVASVLPHLALTGTLSGFRVSLDQGVVIDPFTGEIIGSGPERREWFFDGSVALGLFDRLEVGTTLQSFNGSDSGGNIWGAFGRLAVLRPQDQGVGLAAGLQYVSAPSWDDNVSYQPPRLRFPDRRFREDLFDGPDADDDIQTQLTFYGVASAMLRGFESDWFPDHDVTLSAGWGNGIFNEGERLDFYRYTDSEGWFVGGAAHIQVAGASLLNVMGEWNGFDLNFGTQLDVSGLRVGAHVLGANYWADVGEYRSTKFGFLVSGCLDLSGSGSFRCRPALMARAVPDTVRLPAPPPDTVRITVQAPAPPPVQQPAQPPQPTGTPVSICLATGEVAQVLVTAQGDTLVGPGRVSIRQLRPGVVFAGEYADGRDWFVADRPVTFEQRTYLKAGNEVSLDCAAIERVGDFMGVPLYANRGATRPLQQLYVPVRPGVWQAYQTGLPATRGRLRR